MSRSVKLPAIGLLVVIAIYVVGFLFVTPLMLASSSPVKGVMQSILVNGYQEPIAKLPNDNLIKQWWQSINLYWCNKDKRCEVKN